MCCFQAAHHPGLPGIVGGLAGELSLRAIGYLPTGKHRAAGYTEFCETPGSTEFSVLEPLAMWSDILAAGLDAQNVRLIACPGGALTLAEILLARALGARIAWLDPAAELSLPLRDLLPLDAEGILELADGPDDHSCLPASHSSAWRRSASPLPASCTTSTGSPN